MISDTIKDVLHRMDTRMPRVKASELMRLLWCELELNNN